MKYFQSFLIINEKYGILAKEEVITYRREQSVDSQTKRSEAVSRLKRDKEAQNKLKELNFKKTKNC